MSEEVKQEITLDVPLEILKKEKKIYKSPIAEGNQNYDKSRQVRCCRDKRHNGG